MSSLGFSVNACMSSWRDSDEMLSAEQLNGVAVSWNAIREIESTGILSGKNGINAQGWLCIAWLLCRPGVSLLKLIY